VEAVQPAVESLTNNSFGRLEYKIEVHPVPPGYDLMIYLRHHGFPSPILDWTRSPYVAAFFAFHDAFDDRVAIYSFRECTGGGKSGQLGTPEVHGLGAYVKTHRRHYQQRCEYTVCYKETTRASKRERVYCSHESATFGDGQDDLKKYTIPATERRKVMRRLDMMNIHAFSLFGNEEGLASMLAYREIDACFHQNRG
jgi:FRG domain